MAPSRSLIGRFVHGIGAGVFSTAADKAVEILVTVAGILYVLLKSGLSWKGLVANSHESVTIFMWVACALVSWHAFRSAAAVGSEIQQEMSTAPKFRSGILSPYGLPIESDNPTAPDPHSKLKLYAMACVVLVLCMTMGYLTWTLQKSPESTTMVAAPPSQPNPPVGTAPHNENHGSPVDKYANTTNERLIDLGKSTATELANLARTWQVRDRDITLEEYDRAEGGYYTEAQAKAIAKKERDRFDKQYRKQATEMIESGLSLYGVLLSRVPIFQKQDLLSDRSIAPMTSRLKTGTYQWDDLNQFSALLAKVSERLEEAMRPPTPV